MTGTTINSMINNSEKLSYAQLGFSDFVTRYQEQISKQSIKSPRLFELTLPWLIATYDHMVEDVDTGRANTAKVIVHCLVENDVNMDLKNVEPSIVLAWPLVHENNSMRSLSSFYSSISEPFLLQGETIDVNEAAVKECITQLLALISTNNSWQQCKLGPFDENGLLSSALTTVYPVRKIYSQTDNFYLAGLSSFKEYYQARPSQLKNTIKRREKKLLKTHALDINIVTRVSDFDEAFSAYKKIYQHSWKGDEFSFEFIEQVCRAAMRENKLRLGLLSIDGEPAAAQIWFIQQGTTSGKCFINASIFKLAYSPQFQNFSVGSILSKTLTEFVIDKDKVTSIEFGMGSEPYKKDWLKNKRTRVNYHVFNQRDFYGKLLALRYVTLPKLLKFYS